MMRYPKKNKKHNYILSNSSAIAINICVTFLYTLQVVCNREQRTRRLNNNFCRGVYTPGVNFLTKKMTVFA
jgi:hypothetical protein